MPDPTREFLNVMPGIAEDQFTDEITDFIEIFIKAALKRGDGPNLIRKGANVCASLITSLARGVEFGPIVPPSKKEQEMLEMMVQLNSILREN